MIKLNFPAYDFRILEKEGKLSLFDPVRKKYVNLTPEEWVRQHVIRYLAEEKKVPLSLIRVETEIRLYKTRKRFDLAVYDRNGNALLIVECKAPAIPVTQDVLDQAVRYNITMKVGFLMLTNGLQHIFCQIDTGSGSIRIIEDLPAFTGLSFIL
jgi:type I site-specific restriction endonuclease